MGTDLEISIDKMEISESGLALKETDKLKFHYDKYSPTLTQPNPKGLKVQTFPLQKMGYPSPEEAPPNPGLPYPILNLPEKFKSWLFAGQELVVVYSLKIGKTKRNMTNS